MQTGPMAKPARSSSSKRCRTNGSAEQPPHRALLRWSLLFPKGHGVGIGFELQHRRCPGAPLPQPGLASLPAVGPVRCKDLRAPQVAATSPTAAISASVSSLNRLMATTRHAETFHVGDMARKVLGPRPHGGHIFTLQCVAGNAAVRAECADCCDNDGGGGFQPGLAALYVEEFLGPEVCAETCSVAT
jgi:hypothetical protein